MPTISIIVPLYNLGGKLTRAVTSIVGQDYSDWECIIVDDGSTDGGGAMADRMAERDGRVRVLHQENKGLSNALNAGFKAATGTEFMILSADDALAPQYVRQTHDRMRQSKADVVSTDMIANGQVVKCIGGGSDALKQGNCHHYAALYRRWLFERTGGYKADMNPSWEDYEFWVSCAEAGAKWAHVSEPLFIYYPSATGRSAEADGKDRLLKGKLEGYHPRTFGIGKGLVAVVIPCYAHEQYVREAVDSVAAQTYAHTRTVVVNDASPSWDDACIAGVNCHVLHHNENRGLSAARNSGLSWAQNEWRAEYWIALDADDTLHPEFIERTMSAMKEWEWVYSDVQFIGDAWHTFDLKDWSCLAIGKKHQNPCTFLAQMKMWRDVSRHRGFGYDEAQQMRVGYEDMEFGLACVEQGWSGKRLPGYYFNYRFHKDGSMRTRAHTVKNDLVRYIATRHAWAYNEEGLRMACKGCGGGGATKVKDGKVDIDKLGAVPLGEPLRVTFDGVGTGKQTKVGASGRIYRYSANARSFFIDARDAYLFQAGHFRIERVTRVAPPVPSVPAYAGMAAAAAMPVVVKPPEVRAQESVVFDIGAEAMLDMTPPTPEPDMSTPRARLLALPNITSAHVGKLWKAGFRSPKTIGELSVEKLTRITGLDKKEAQEVIQHARLQHKPN